jgi:hypothetical protein
MRNSRRADLAECRVSHTAMLSCPRTNTRNSKQFSLIFLPDSLKEALSIKGWAILLGLFVYEGISLFRPLRRIDHAGHLGGLVAGIIAAQMMEKPAAASRGHDGKPTKSTLHAAFYDLRDGVRAYVDGDEEKLKQAKKGRGGNVGVE